jgi:hypothetical protein
MLTFFPDAWGGDKTAPTCPTPTGAACLFCNEPIRAEDCGVFMPYLGALTCDRCGSPVVRRVDQPGYMHGDPFVTTCERRVITDDQVRAESRDVPQHQMCLYRALGLGLGDSIHEIASLVGSVEAVEASGLITRPPYALAQVQWRKQLEVIAAGLLRLPDGTQEELREQLEGEMSSYSEENWSAGWLHELEFRLWSGLMDGEDAGDERYARENPHIATMNLRLWRIGQLALRVNGWFAWDEDWREQRKNKDYVKDYTAGARFVPMAEWLPRYAAWRAAKIVTRAATRAEWEERAAREREDAQHWCQHAEPPASCDTCKGSCSCHWREEQGG